MVRIDPWSCRRFFEQHALEGVRGEPRKWLARVIDWKKDVACQDNREEINDEHPDSGYNCL